MKTNSKRFLSIILAGILAVLIAKKLPQTWYEWEFGKKEAQTGKHEIH